MIYDNPAYFFKVLTSLGNDIYDVLIGDLIYEVKNFHTVFFGKPTDGMVYQYGKRIISAVLTVVVVSEVAKAGYSTIKAGIALKKTGASFKFDLQFFGQVIKGGRFGDVNKVKGPGEVGHHMAQNAFNETINISRNDGPALLMSIADHELTRTFRSAGARTMVEDAGLGARTRLLKDIQDIRKLFGTKYNEGLLQMLEYAKTLNPYKKM
jgi:hypothetical protein